VNQCFWFFGPVKARNLSVTKKGIGRSKQPGEINSRGDVDIANELLRSSVLVRASSVDSSHSSGDPRQGSTDSYLLYRVGLAIDLIGLIRSAVPWRTVRGAFAARSSKQRRRREELQEKSKSAQIEGLAREI